jgi:AsmA protein
MSTSRQLPAWVWIAAAPVVLLLVAWAALAILLPPARANRLVREQLSRSLARDVRFERVSVSLFPPVRLSVRRFELAEPGGFERGAALTVGSIDLDLDVFALLGRRVKVQRLSLDAPALRVFAPGTRTDGVRAQAPALRAPRWT